MKHSALILLLGIGSLFLSIAQARPNMTTEQKLHGMPLWGCLLQAKNPDNARAELERQTRAFSATKPSELRQALLEYLNQVRNDPVELSYRLDNGRIICAVFFHVGPEHPFDVYFEKHDPHAYKVIMPTFMADVNRGRNVDASDIKVLLDEFDRLSNGKK